MTRRHAAATRLARLSAALLVIPCLVLLAVAAWATTESLSALDERGAGLRVCDASQVTACSREVTGTLQYRGSPRRSAVSYWSVVDPAGDAWPFKAGPGSGAAAGEPATVRVQDGRVLRVLMDGEWVEPLGAGRNRAVTMLALLLAALCGSVILGRHAASAVRRNRNPWEGADWKPTKTDALLCLGIVLLFFWGWSSAYGLVWWAAPLVGAALFLWITSSFIGELFRKH